MARKRTGARAASYWLVVASSKKSAITQYSKETIMGWGNCGTDSEGRPIGYMFPATCDHPGCNKEINRGLSYACGDMHGETEHSCAKYFCEEHLSVCVQTDDDRLINICEGCGKAHLEDGEWIENDYGVLVRNPE